MALDSGARGPLTAQRLVRVALRRRREAGELTQEQVADAMDWSLAKVVRVESGASTPSTSDLRALALLYGIGPEDMNALIELGRMARRRPWWTQYRDWLPRSRLLAGAFADEAEAHVCFSNTTIPELLRTEAYARTVLSAQYASASEARLRLEVQLRRSYEYLRDRALLERPSARFVLDEAVILRTAGGGFSHSEQLDHLLSLPDRAISLRILPFDGAGLMGAVADSFSISILNTDEGIVFIDATADGLLIDRLDVYALYRRTFEELWAASLDEASSAELIKSVR